MKNNASIDKDDILFEAFLRVAAKEALREEMDELPSLEELNEQYPRSESLDKKVYSAIRKEIAAVKRRQLIRTTTKVAAGFALFFAITMAALMSVEASRNFILNLFVDIRNDHITFDFGQGNRDAVDSGDVDFRHIPAGFELVNSQILDDMSIYIFVDSRGHQIVIQQHHIGAFLFAADNEYREYTIILLNDQEMHLFMAQDAQDPSIVMWTSEEYTFVIHANIEMDNILRIAESMIAR